MDKIKVRDREFTVSIPEAKILQRVAEVAAQINNDLKNENPLFLAVLNGSFVFAADRCVVWKCLAKFHLSEWHRMKELLQQERLSN